MNRSRVLKKIRNIVLGTVAVFLILIGSAVAYTWYMGTQSTAELQAEPEVVANEKPVQASPSQPAPDAVIGVSTQMITTPVQPGENASLTVKTNAGATCAVTVTYGKVGEEENQSRDSGLVEKVADRFGMITWTWTVEPLRPNGEWPVEVTCANEANSAYLRVDLVVGEPAS